MGKPPWVKGGEGALVERLRRHDELAWQEFNAHNKTYIYGYCLRMLRNEDDAKDVCQEVFMRAVKAIGDFRGEASLGTWLYRIAINLCRSRFRPPSRPTMVDDRWIADLPDESPNPEQAMMDRERRAAIEGAIGQVPETFREAVVLCDVQGRSYNEIADILNVPIDTVKSRIHRGRRRLRELLADYWP